MTAITGFSRGIVVAGSEGSVWSYESTQNELFPYRLIDARIGHDDEDKSLREKIPTGHLQSIALANEEWLYYIDSDNQLGKVNITLDGSDKDTTKFENVHAPFHKTAITGMDVCLRKPLIVTCSEKEIKIWNYETKSLEIETHCTPGEEAKAVAFHPSGFHLIVAFADKISLKNVLSESIKEY